MRALFSKKAKTNLGLDIGTKYVKAVCLSISDEHTEVLAVACEPITGSPFEERDIKDFDPISKALKKVKHTLKQKSKSCVIAVAGSSVISKIVRMEPNQTDYELENQIELEADSLIPYPIDEMYVDFEQQHESETHAGKVDVLLSAAHRALVDARITIVREQAIEPQAVDIEINALGNIFLNHLTNKNDETLNCCIHVGASLMQVVIVESGKIVYTKEHAFGLNKMIQDINLIYGVDSEEIELKLHSDEAPEDWLGEGSIGFVSNLQQQIQRILQMFVSTTHKAQPNTILLSGGVCNIPEITTTLSSDLAATVDLFNPFENMQLAKSINQERLDAIAPQLSIAVGLASGSH